MNHLRVAIVATAHVRRVGVPKLCLPWARTTILGHVIDRWTEAGAEDIVVIHGRGGLSAVTQELDRLGFPLEQRVPSQTQGRGEMGAIMTAAEQALENPLLSHLIVTLGDQPQIRTQTLRALLAACENAHGKLVPPVYRGRRGRRGLPCALPASLISDLSTSTADTFGAFLHAQTVPVAELVCHDSGILFDMDAPAGVERPYRAAGAALTAPLLT